MAEIGRCDPAAGPDEVARRPEPSSAAEPPVSTADEIRAALAWTRNAAYREYHFAEALRGRLPTVFTALDDGAICRSQAWLFSELCAELTDEQVQVVCDRLLPKAGRLTTGELAARIKKLAIALDPEWAARRYATVVRDRDVIGYLDEDGTATVTGRRLPADQAAAACARIEELAKAAKHAGHPGRIGPLDGRWAHATREEIIADLLARCGASGGSRAPGRAVHPARVRPTPRGDSRVGTGDRRDRPHHRGHPARREVVLRDHRPQASGDWAAVITDIAAQYAVYRDQDTPGARCAQKQDPGARFAGAVLRRHVQVRDRVCVYPGCRCPARHADLDHTVDHSHGGLTPDDNSGPLWPHDHGLKHEGGWRLCQPKPA